MSFKPTLAYSLMQLVDNGLQGPSGLPFADEFVVTSLLKQGGYTTMDYSETVKVLQHLKIFCATLYHAESYSLTISGAQAVEDGGSRRERLCNHLANAPGGSMLVKHMKTYTPFSDMSNNSWKNLLKDLTAAKIITRTTAEEGQTITLVMGARFDDLTVLRNIQQHGHPGDLHKGKKKVLESNLVRIYMTPWYRLNPGPMFNPHVSLEGISPTLSSARHDAKLQYEHPPDDVVGDYYTKVYLLSLVMQGAPPSVGFGREKVFINQGCKHPNMSEFWTRRTTLDLPLANTIALFFVCEETSDVAAATITYPAAGHAHIYVAKNQVKETDEIHGMNLLGLLVGDLKLRYGKLSTFVDTGLRILLGYCRKKIFRRLNDIDINALKELHEYLAVAGLRDELSDPHDGYLLHAMEKINKSSRREAIVALLRVICQRGTSVTTAHDPWILDVMRFAYILFVSPTFALEITTWSKSTERTATIMDHLRKVGCYVGGLISLWGALTSTCVATGAVKNPFRLEVTIIPSTPQRTIPLRQDWYVMLQEFWQSGRGASTRLDTTKASFIKAWCRKEEDADLSIPDVIPTFYHCELALSDFLRSVGCRQAVIGVSKHSCQLCSVALEERNERDEMWLLSGGHHQLYQSLLPSYTDTSAPEVVDRLVRAVDDFLRDQMAQVKDVNQSPPQRIHHDFGEPGKVYESLFD